MTPDFVPDVEFQTRVRNEALGGPNPFEWKTITTDDIFAGNKVVLFGLPGAFTPACSEEHLPGYEKHFDELIAAGADKVVCTSVNDAFVMFQWAKAQGISKVFMLPDGNGTFARRLGMLVDRKAQGMGLRSWRYSMFVDDKKIDKIFAEPGMRDDPPGVPLQDSGAEAMLEYLRGRT